MALPASGAITLNEIHVEAGGTSGTSCFLNDSDIRALIGKGEEAQMFFNEWHGAVNEFVLTFTLASWSTNLPGAAVTQRFGWQSYNSRGSATSAVSKTGYFGGKNVVSFWIRQVQPNDSAAIVYLETSYGDVNNTDDDAFKSVSVNGLASYSRSAAGHGYDPSTGRDGWSWNTTLAVGYGTKSPLQAGTNTLTFTK